MDEKQLLSIGVSFFGSLLLGAFKKHKTPLPNKAIPITNPLIFGGSVAGLTNDIGDTVGAVAGSLLATGAHMLTRKIFGMKRSSRLP